MKQSFRGYYKPTVEEFPKLWEECFFVFDTNVLLALYRYSSETRNQLIEILNEISERKKIWIPHQIGFEYQENRLDVIFEQEKINDKVKKTFDDLLDHISTFQEHPWIDLEYLAEKITEFKEEIIKKIEKDKEIFFDDDEHASSFKNDKIRDFLTLLFEGNIGSPFSEEEMKKLYDECDERYENKIPPGFKDITKDKNDPTKLKKYGDFILWKQVIEKAKESKMPIIFVTEEKKEDWWWIPNGKTIGPRYELIEEMYNCAQVQFYMYRTDRFTKFAKKHFFQKDVDPKVIKEIQDVMIRDSFKDYVKGYDSNILIPYEKIGTSNSEYFSDEAWKLSSIRKDLNNVDKTISQALMDGNDVPNFIEGILNETDYEIHNLKMKFLKSSAKIRVSLSEKYEFLKLTDKQFNETSSKSKKNNLYNKINILKNDIIESEELLNHIGVSLDELESLIDELNRIKFFINNKNNFIEL